MIELLVVIAMIAIFAGILFPVYSRSREQARKTACMSNLKELGMAFAMYLQDYDDTFPFWVLPCYNNPDFPRGGLHWISSLVSPSETLLLVDSWNDLVTPWAHTSTGIYPRVAFANGPGPAAPDDYTVIDLNLALDTLSRHSGGANILFVDGHTKWFKGDQIISRTHGGKSRICGQDLTR